MLVWAMRIQFLEKMKWCVVGNLTESSHVHVNRYLPGGGEGKTFLKGWTFFTFKGTDFLFIFFKHGSGQQLWLRRRAGWNMVAVKSCQYSVIAYMGQHSGNFQSFFTLIKTVWLSFRLSVCLTPTTNVLSSINYLNKLILGNSGVLFQVVAILNKSCYCFIIPIIDCNIRPAKTRKNQEKISNYKKTDSGKIKEDF